MLSHGPSSLNHHLQISRTSLGSKITHIWFLMSHASQSSRYEQQCKRQLLRRHQDQMAFLCDMFSGNNAWFLGGAPPDWSNWPARAGSAQKLRLVSGRGLRMVSAGGRHTLRPVRIQISRAPCDCFYIIKGPERERPKIKQNSKDFFNDDGIDRSIRLCAVLRRMEGTSVLEREVSLWYCSRLYRQAPSKPS